MVLQPERDWLDYLSFAINVVAAAGSLFAVFLAVKAYQSAKKANDLAERQGRESRELVARERRTTFELEVLRDLLGWIDDRDVIRSIAEGGMPFSNSRVGARLAMLPEEDLDFLRHAMTTGARDLPLRLGVHDDDAYEQEPGTAVTPGRRKVATPALCRRLAERLRQDIHDAVRRRIVIQQAPCTQLRS